MAMRGGMYNANKRKKELARKKKQDEKRLKRQKTSSVDSETQEEAVVNSSDAEAPETPDSSPAE